MIEPREGDVRTNPDILGAIEIWTQGKWILIEPVVDVAALREENEKLRKELITSSKKYYDIGYACAKDMANDKVEILSAENKRLERENKKSRVALLRIQCIAQDITRPVPFQEEDDENRN